MKHKKPHPLESLINKFLNGKSSAEENELLRDFTDTYRKDNARDIPVQNKVLEGKIRHALELRIRKHRKKKQAFRYVAAASVVLCAGMFFALQDHNTGDKRQLTVNTSSQMDSLILGDGSKIYLNRHTVFSYPEKFADNSRTVKLLKGSAYFRVARDENKPFVIVSEGVKTEVLGTTFNIIKNDSTLSVTVSSGKVKVSTPSKSVELQADEQALMENRSGKLTKKKANARLYSNWMNKDIDYEDISLRELSTLVELRYGLPFRFEDSELEDYRVKVSFLKQDSLESVVSKLNFITHVQLKIDHHVITVKKGEPH